MGVGLNIKSLDDFVEATLARYDRSVWTDISLVNQYYMFADRFMNGGSGGMKNNSVSGGQHLEWKVQVANTSSAHASGVFSEDRTDVKNLLKRAYMPWAKTTVSMSYDVLETAFQGDDMTMIVNEILVREHAMFNDFYEFKENELWSSPASSDLEPMEMAGIPYWLQKSATEGLSGGNPTGWTSGAGFLSSTTYTNWRNRTGTYSRITRDDFVSKILKHMSFCEFKPAHAYKANGGAAGKPRYELFTVYDVLEEAQQYLDSRNDNLRDMAGLAGQAKLMGVDLTWIPKLTHNETVNARTYDSTRPVYGVDFNAFEYFTLAGWKWKRHQPVQAPNQHNVRNVFADSVGNIRCTNRRSNFAIYRA